MLRTPLEKLKIINRNEELENAYNQKKNLFKKTGKIEEFIIKKIRIFFLIIFEFFSINSDFQAI